MTASLGGDPLAITDHRLHGVPFVPDNAGPALKPELILLHFTVTGSGPATARSLQHETQRASVHLVLDRDGSLIQQVRFDRVAYHAGKSEWRGRESVSRFSIGVEIVNYGPLFPRDDGGWSNVYGHRVDVSEPYHGRHQGPPGCSWEHWDKYTDEQMLTLAELCRLLCRVYDIDEIVGHDDVSPGRKRDPGPAFPWQEFRMAVFGPDEVTQTLPPPAELADR